MRTRSFFYNSWLNCYQGQITPQDFSSKLNNTRTQPKIIKPLHKDASLHCMDNAAEAWLVFVSAKFQAPLPGKCGSQPVPDLWWHWVWLDVTQLILCIHQPPAVKVTFTKKQKLIQCTISAGYFMYDLIQSSDLQLIYPWLLSNFLSNFFE